MLEQPKKVRPWDLFNKNLPRVSEVNHEERMNICLSCDKLIKLTKQCKACGCFMEQKTKLAHARCPLGKWDMVKIGE